MKALCWSIVTVCLGWSLYSLSGLRTEYSVEQFYPKEHALLAGHDKITKQYRLNQDSPYLFVIQLPEKDAWLYPAHIGALQKVSTHIQHREDVKTILSLTQIEGASTGTDELVIGNIFDREKPANWKEAVQRNPLLYPLLVTKDFRATLLAVEPKAISKQAREITHRELLAQLTQSFPQAQILSAGVPLLQTRLSDMIQTELGQFLILTAVAFCLFFYLIFSHWSAIACAFVTILGTNIFSLALMSAWNIPMNAILVTLPVIVSVSVMSLLIHTLHLWSQRRTPGAGFHEALMTCKEISLPNALGITTTALGFLALAPSPIPIIGQYGWTVALILSCVAVLSQLMMLCALPLVKPVMRSWPGRPATWALWCLSYPREILAATLGITIVGILMLSQLNFSIRLFDDLPKGDDVRANTDWIDRSFGGVLNLDVTTQAQETDFWRRPASLQRLNALTQELRRHPHIGTVVSIADFFQGEIPKSSSQIAETFFLFSMAEKNPLLSFMSEDGKDMRLAVRLSDLTTTQLKATKKDIQQTIQQHFPELTYAEGGMASYAHDINRDVAKALIFEFWQPLVFIGLFLVLMFRSFKWAVIACLPNLIPPAFLVMALAITGTAVKPGIALIFSIALGFAFNNTLYILSRLRQLPANRESLLKALLMEANPCLLESLIMFVGFAIFLFSKFDMNQTFGGFMLISILAGFLADLVFLPALLHVFPNLYVKKLAQVPIAKETHKMAASIAILLVLGFSGNVLAMEAKDILKKSQQQLDAKDDQAKVEMKIIEENGESKSRSLTLQTLRANGFSVMARLQSPADIKDMAFLGQVDEDGNEMQYIYLPSSGQVRRLVTGKTKAGLLGSEISPEDLNSQAIKSATVKLIKTDAKSYWIELKPNAETSEYTHVITKIAKKDLLPQVTEYYIQKKMKKTVQFMNYKKIGAVWRAQMMKVKNHLNGRGTEIVLSDIKVNSGLSADDFSQSNLKEN
jgi:uncharacterized protein